MRFNLAPVNTNLLSGSRRRMCISSACQVLFVHEYSVIVFFELLDRRHFVCNEEARSAPTSTPLRHATRSAAAIMLTVTNGCD